MCAVQYGNMRNQIRTLCRVILDTGSLIDFTDDREGGGDKKYPETWCHYRIAGR